MIQSNMINILQFKVQNAYNIISISILSNLINFHSHFLKQRLQETALECCDDRAVVSR